MFHFFHFIIRFCFFTPSLFEKVFNKKHEGKRFFFCSRDFHIACILLFYCFAPFDFVHFKWI